MSKKVLSTGTLSLRFMQNANRLKQLKEVELDRAKVEDDGQWEVSSEVKEAWGISYNSGSTETVTYESSYLPFLFPSTIEQSSDSSEPSSSNVNRPKGRRAFDKKGKEIVDEANDGGSHFDSPHHLGSEPVSTASADATQESKGKGKKRMTSRAPHPNPTSISLSNSSSLKGFDDLRKPKESKTAKQAIFESSSTGEDLRVTASQKTATSNSPVGFLKPSGVDEPSKPKRDSPELKADSGLVNGTRAKRVKREHDRASDHPTEGGERRKKKKKNTEGA